MPGFDLTNNPFVVLGISPRANREEINDAFSDRALDADSPDQERALNLARSAITLPRERLRAELAYPLEMRPADVRSALVAHSVDGLRGAANRTHGIARANLLAQAYNHVADSVQCRALTDDLLSAYSQLDFVDIHRCVEEQRSLSGFPSVARVDLEDGLAQLCSVHAATAIASLEKYTLLPTEMTRIVETIQTMGDSPARMFINKLLLSYEKAIGPMMETKAREALEALDELVGNHGIRTGHSPFETSLRAWDRLAQPLQLADEILGMDEVQSKALFEQIRRRAIALANDQGRHAEALQISQLAQEIFAELPAATVHLETDVKTLAEIEGGKSIERLVGPLDKAVTLALGQLAMVSSVIKRDGFNSTASPPIGALVRAFRDLLDQHPSQEVIELAAAKIRDLSIALNNERKDFEAARLVLDLLLANSKTIPTALVDRIKEDRRVLLQSLLSSLMQQALKDGRLDAAIGHCDALLEETKAANEITQLQTLRATLEKRISDGKANKVKTGVGWAIAAGIVGLIIAGSNSEPDYSTQQYTGSSDDAVGFAADDAAIAADEAMAAAERNLEAEQAAYAEAETMPATTYISSVYDRPQIRYCLKQQERIDAARTVAVTFSQNQQFNALVSDWNGRCSQFRYDPADMNAVNNEVSMQAAVLRQEGLALIAKDRSIDLLPEPEAQPDPSIGRLMDAPVASDPAYDWDYSGAQESVGD